MATLDVLTLDEARDTIGAKSDVYDARLSSLNTAVTQRFDKRLGPIVSRAVTETCYDGGRALIPRQLPVLTWTTITEYAPSATELTAETPGTLGDYLWIPSDGVLYRRSGGRTSCWRHPVVLAYTAGRFASTAVVDARFKEAVAITLAHMWRSEKGSGTQTFGQSEELAPFGPSFAIPRRAFDLVADQLATSGIG